MVLLHLQRLLIIYRAVKLAEVRFTHVRLLSISLGTETYLGAFPYLFSAADFENVVFILNRGSTCSEIRNHVKEEGMMALVSRVESLLSLRYQVNVPPPLISIFEFFQTPRSLLGIPFINFKEMDYFCKPFISFSFFVSTIYAQFSCKISCFFM